MLFSDGTPAGCSPQHLNSQFSPLSSLTYKPYKPLPPLADPVASATILSGLSILTAISVLLCSSSESGLGHPLSNILNEFPPSVDFKKSVLLPVCLI